MKETPEYKTQESIYQSISGGPELLAWFGQVPSFHDAEIISLDLNRRKPSKLKIHAWNSSNKIGPDGYGILEKHAIVTFTIDHVFDLQLDGFSHQNVISNLDIFHLRPNPGRERYYSRSPPELSFEMVLYPCFGLDGIIKCEKISINYQAGKPSE